MPMYVPRYLDRDLVRDLLDYLDLEVPDSTEVETAESAENSRRAGANRFVDVGAGRARRDERRETFTLHARPARLLSTAIEGVRPELLDVDAHPDGALVQRGFIQVTGRLHLARVSEVPQMIRPMLPVLLSRTQQGSGGAISDAEAAGVMFGSETGHPAVLNIDAATDYTLAAVIRTDRLMPGNDVDDLEDDLTLFGVVEKLLPGGASTPLDRYVLPGLNRSLRRAVGDLSELLARLPGDPISAEDLVVAGPGALIRSIAIFP